MTNGVSPPLSGDEGELLLSPLPDEDEDNDLPPVVGGYPDLLPPNKTKLERALASSTGRLDNEINAPIIDTLLQPWLIPASYLPWLAWHVSLSLWDWEWDEFKRRSVIARAVELNRMKGTAKALRTYCDIMDSEVKEIMVPPQEFWIGSNLSKEEWDVWIHSMPEVRIKLIHGIGTTSVDEWYNNEKPQWSGPPAPAESVWQVWTLDLGQLTWTVDANEFATQAAADEYAAGLSPPETHFVTRSNSLAAIPTDTIPITGHSTLGIIAPNAAQSPPSSERVWAVYVKNIIGGATYWLLDREFATQALADAFVAAALDPTNYIVSPQAPSLPAPTVTPSLLGSFFTLDQGPVLYGRRVVERIGGVDYPLQYVEKTTTLQENKTIDVERFSTIGLSPLGYFIDNDFVEEKKYLGANEIEPQLITLRLDGTYTHETSELGLTMVWPDLKPVSPRYERNSDIGDAGVYCYLDDFFMGRHDAYDIASGATEFNYPPAIIERNRAGELLADRIFLVDPTMPVPWMEGFSFIGVSRLGMPAYRAEVIVDLHQKQPNDFIFIGEGFIEQSLVGELDDKPIERAIYALTAAKAIRDKVMVRFDPLRQITSLDILTPTTKVGDWVPDNL